MTLRGLYINLDGAPVMLDVIVRPMPTSDVKLLRVLFVEHPHGGASAGNSAPDTAPETDRTRALEQELRHTRESLQATVEEMAVSMEELRSSNEELVTSKEELQSLNEELITINAEHQRVILDLAQANDDMKNLLDSAGIATVFLDNNLRVKRFTPRITSVINLISADTARPISDIRLNLRYRHEEFTRDLQRVIDTLTPYETQVQAHDDERYLMRISPYRTSDNFIDGVVVTFTNIATIKQLEEESSQSRATAEAALNSMHDPLVVLDPQQRVVTANRALYDLLETNAHEAVGQRLYDLGNFTLDVPELYQEIRDVIASEQALYEYLIDLNVPQLGQRKFKIAVEPVLGEEVGALFLLRLEDVTAILERAAHEGTDIHGQASDAE